MTLPSGNLALFDVTSPATSWVTIAGTATGPNTQPQSIYRNNASGDLWMLQLSGGTNDKRDGNLTLNHFPFQTPGHFGGPTSMSLRGFGHGIGFGVQNVASGPDIIWMECNSQNENGVGFGNAITSFPYSSGSTLQNSQVSHLFPIPGAVNLTCCLRTGTNPDVLVVRYEQPEGTGFYTAFSLQDAQAGNFSSPLMTTFPEPLVVSNPDKQTGTSFQGWTFAGRYLYMLDGYGKGNPYGIPNKVNLTSADLDNVTNGVGGYITRATATADSTADPREPEGIWVDMFNGAYVLGFGITNYGTAPSHKADLYYKQGTVAGTPPS